MGRRRFVQIGLLTECLGLALSGAVSPPSWQGEETNVAWTTTPAASMATPWPAAAELRRQLNPLEQIASLSTSLALVSSSAQLLASSLNQVQSSAASAQASLAANAASAQASLAANAASVAANAASATAAASLAVSSAQASASSAVAAAISMASSASSSASSAMAAAAAAMADATSVRTQASSQIQQAQGSAVSVTQAAIAVVGAIIGSALLTLAGFFIFIRFRRAKLRAQEDDVAAQAQANAALNRAVMSYIGKGEMPPRSEYTSYSGYAPSELGERSFVMSRPSTADKSAIPGMGVLNLSLQDPTRQPSTGLPLETVDEVQPETPKDDEAWEHRRASNWPFAKGP